MGLRSWVLVAKRWVNGPRRWSGPWPWVEELGAVDGEGKEVEGGGHGW